MGITNFDVVQANAFIGGDLMTQGQVFFVNPRTGNDGNDGKSPELALKTVRRAFTLCTAKQNDVIYLLSAGASTSADCTDYLSAVLTWNKDNVHLIGVTAPCRLSQRARIAQLSTATTLVTMVNITAQSCIFKNIQFFQGVASATAKVDVQITGARNYFENVHFAGIGHATQVAASAASCKIDGGSENLFKNCVFGVDTITADNSTQGELWFDGSASRNIFEDCIFTRFISNAGYVAVTFNDTTAIDRWVLFKNCLFITCSANDATAQTNVLGSVASLTQGSVILVGCNICSPGTAAPWQTGTQARLKIANGAANANTGGKFASL